MTERQASDTAAAVAALRAAHRLVDRPPWVLDDPVAEQLLAPDARERLRANLDRLDHPRVRALRSHVVLRSRYAEDALRAAVERGVSQYLILGAGYDTFGYRQPEWVKNLRVFEVDHPASQRAKRERLEAAGIAVPPNVEFVPVDFETETLEAGLARSGFDRGQAAFLSWLGVMVYLTLDAVRAVFTFAASLPAGSEIAFTFSPPEGTDGDAGSASPTAAAAAAAGEPFQTRLSRQQLEELLETCGFSSLSFLEPDDAVQRYLGARDDALPPPRGVRIGSARV